MASDTARPAGLPLHWVKLSFSLDQGPALEKCDLNVAAPDALRAIDLGIAEARRRHPGATKDFNIDSCSRFAWVDLVDAEALPENHARSQAVAQAAERGETIQLQVSGYVWIVTREEALNLRNQLEQQLAHGAGIVASVVAPPDGSGASAPCEINVGDVYPDPDRPGHVRLVIHILQWSSRNPKSGRTLYMLAGDFPVASERGGFLPSSDRHINIVGLQTRSSPLTAPVSPIGMVNADVAADYWHKKQERSAAEPPAPDTGGVP